MRDVLSVRQGDIGKVYPTMFSEDYPKPLVANFIDVAARDLAEAMAPLPSFNCSATNMVSDSARKQADTRTRIANYYSTSSELQIQMYAGADWFNTYGMLPGIVEIDYETNTPKIRLLNPFGTQSSMTKLSVRLSLLPAHHTSIWCVITTNIRTFSSCLIVVISFLVVHPTQ
jgi:hypothetical protein